MKKKVSNQIFVFVSLTVLSLLVPCRAAEAYLDGGTGSMILQVLIGGVAGIVLALKLFWHRLSGMFSRKKPSDNEPLV